MTTKFNPAAVPIHYTLNFQQVNTLLKGLGKLPHEEVNELYASMRSVALHTLQAAEDQAKAPPPSETPAGDLNPGGTD